MDLQALTHLRDRSGGKEHQPWLYRHPTISPVSERLSAHQGCLALRVFARKSYNDCAFNSEERKQWQLKPYTANTTNSRRRLKKFCRRCMTFLTKRWINPVCPTYSTYGKPACWTKPSARPITSRKRYSPPAI